jgi:hypothetical protein
MLMTSIDIFVGEVLFSSLIAWKTVVGSGEVVEIPFSVTVDGCWYNLPAISMEKVGIVKIVL